jgi:hypothetical protein
MQPSPACRERDDEGPVDRCVQGFIKTEPLPDIFYSMGQAVADLWEHVTGFAIDRFEGLMIIMTTVLMTISLLTWVVIHAGNESDKAARLTKNQPMEKLKKEQ